MRALFKSLSRREFRRSESYVVDETAGFNSVNDSIMSTFIKENEQSPVTTADQNTRNWIATWMTVGGMAGVGVLGFFVIFFAADRSSGSQMVLGSLLPLLGTWVGTVLAFYFAKANFESAARNTKEILGMRDRLESIVVESVMLRISETTVTKKILGAAETAESQKVTELTAMMRAAGRNRLPILAANNIPLYAVHLSTLTDFVASLVLDSARGGKQPDEVTIADLRAADVRLYQKIIAWVCVKTGSTLADAKQAMEATPNCSDVFVTASGLPSDPVLGWITNVDIGLRSKA